MTEVLTGLPPIAGAAPRVLVLGSMPGGVSLRRGEYYAHPRNRFWPLMARLAGVPNEADYAERTRALASSGIAVWDVLKHCERSGSLDTAIARASEVPNDFRTFLREQPSICRILFNGSRAAEVFRRRVEPVLPAAVLANIELTRLPSTSPANATFDLESLVAAWGGALRDR